MVCCFFGHRTVTQEVEPRLRRTILQLLDETDDSLTCYVGNQGQFDAMVRRVLRELQAGHSALHYAVVLAYLPTQDRALSSDTYADTLYPDGLETVPKRFCIDRRNRWMLDRTDAIICYVSSGYGGAAKYVQLAEKRRIRVLNLWEPDGHSPSQIPPHDLNGRAPTA